MKDGVGPIFTFSANKDQEICQTGAHAVPVFGRSDPATPSAPAD